MKISPDRAATGRLKQLGRILEKYTGALIRLGGAAALGFVHRMKSGQHATSRFSTRTSPMTQATIARSAGKHYPSANLASNTN
jgi:hypothetical protein